MKYIYELMIKNYARWTCLFQSPRSRNLYQIFSFFDYAFDDWDVVSIP